MPEPRFERLETELLDGGVAADCVQELIAELRDHLADLEREALEAGETADGARALARAALGSEAAIAAAALSRPELMSWPRRWPRTASCLRSAVLIALLPGVPVLYCWHRGSLICRWSVSACLGALMTGLLLLILQWTVL